MIIHTHHCLNISLCRTRSSHGSCIATSAVLLGGSKNRRTESYLRAARSTCLIMRNPTVSTIWNLPAKPPQPAQALQVFLVTGFDVKMRRWFEHQPHLAESEVIAELSGVSPSWKATSSGLERTRLPVCCPSMASGYSAAMPRNGGGMRATSAARD